MTGIFSTPTPEKCNHYARFMQHLGRHEAEAIFWTLFIFMIFLLIIASTRYARAFETHVDCSDVPLCHDDCRLTRLNCLYVSLCCSALAVPAAVMQAFAALNIQFCDGEDLMMLYWRFWTLIQVGSVIAILGIAFNQWKTLRDAKLPPWSTALGTPVLVIAGVGHGFWVCLNSASRKFRGKDDDARSTTSADGIRLSQAPTVSNYPNATQIGWSLTGERLYTLPSNHAVELSNVSATQTTQSAPRSAREVQFVENRRDTGPTEVTALHSRY